VKANIVVLPGDGVGPEVVNAALSVLATVCDAADAQVSIDVHLIGGRAIDELGTPLPDETLDACMAADAVLLGAVGGPAWDHLRGERRCEAGLLRLRREMDVFANVRPVKVHPHLTDRTTLRPEVIRGTDLVIVRELTGGAYFGQPRGRTGTGPDEIARDSIVYSAAEVERVARVAFKLAQSRRGELVSIDKANVLITSQLWREVVSALAAEYPDVTLTHELVDSFAMRLVREPATVDVVVAENLFGDILSDEAAVLAGSLVSARPTRGCTSRFTGALPASRDVASPTPTAPSSRSRCCSGIRSTATISPRRSSPRSMSASPRMSSPPIWVVRRARMPSPTRSRARRCGISVRAAVWRRERRDLRYDTA
jgi:3-isopropylmalate dehydrogenase